MPNFFYSNCLFEAIKAKVKDWKNVSVHFIPGWLEPTGHFHFYWKNSSSNMYYDFRMHPDYHKNFHVYFKGYIEVSTKPEWEKRMFRSSELLCRRLQKKYGFNSVDERKNEINELNRKIESYREESAFFRNFTNVSLLNSEKYLNELNNHKVNYVVPFKKILVDGIPVMNPNGEVIPIKHINQIPEGTTDFLVL